MKKDNGPLIVAVFLAIGGLLSGVAIFRDGTRVADITSVRRNVAFFIPTAQGAENAAMLFGARTPYPVTAVSGNEAQAPELVFSVTLGAVKDPGSDIDQRTSSTPRYNSSLSR
jgi:hypothetical protein